MEWDEDMTAETRDRVERWLRESGALQAQSNSSRVDDDYLDMAEDNPEIGKLSDFNTLEMDIERTINFETKGMQEYR